MKNYPTYIIFIFLFVLSFTTKAQAKKVNTVSDKQQTGKKNSGNNSSQKTVDVGESNLKNAVSSNTVTTIPVITTNSHSTSKTAVSSNTVVIYTDTTGSLRNTKN